jgi:hypothetical protein
MAIGLETGLNLPSLQEPTITNDDAVDTTLPSTGDFARADRASSATNATSGVLPGKRLQNPLGDFLSSTYQITLYMISPDAYNAFIQSGRKNIKTAGVNGAEGVEAVIVAQSGGINNEANKRAQGFELDYYIDDLKIKSAINGKNTQTASNVTEITFNIFEPYGFSFISNLKRAQRELKKYSKIKNYDSVQNASKQFFILGLRFQGYDNTGRVVSGSEMQIPELFYDIIVTSIKFKVDGKATTYNLTAASIRPQTAFGMKHGRLDNGATVIAATVADAIGGRETTPEGIRGFLDILNKTQQDLLNPARLEGHEGIPSIEIANVYKVRWLGDAEQTIGSAKIVSKGDLNKKRLSPSEAKVSDDSTQSLADSTSPNFTKRLGVFKNDTSIMQTISNIILQSSYLEDTMKAMSKSDLTANSNVTEDEGETYSGDTDKAIRWYNLGAEVKILGWDRKVGDYAYEITYVIQEYMTPASIGVYGNPPDKYYGPHKRYQYWYTGKNSEILKYEQSLNNSFFNVVLVPSGDAASHGNGADIAQYPNKGVNGNNQGREGMGFQAQNIYVTSLYDPGSWAEAKLQILGDPDFLMCDSPGSINDAYNKFYGTDGFTVNPNGGQVFIEIKFNEGVDYARPDGTIDGLMDINSSILFWDYPPAVAKKIKGVSYLVLGVISSFSKGTFVQDITAAINTFPNYKDKSADTTREKTIADAYADPSRGQDVIPSDEVDVSNWYLGESTADLGTTGDFARMDRQADDLYTAPSTGDFARADRIDTTSIPLDESSWFG